ncbi:ODHCY [Symbiodinium pilosum]|uniref:ODHCY protein n=1 Tax=Symbiodinium pilosum TaxID=2952 RepID=A0A812UVX4_SYMPI|nr:ODHCY [Symbiodinium pilosum]
MMYDLETSLQKLCNDCSITLPYWNSFREAGNIWGSKTWAPNRYGNPFGVSGYKAQWCYDYGWTQCVVEGIGKGFTMNPHADKSSCSLSLPRGDRVLLRWTGSSNLPRLVPDE